MPGSTLDLPAFCCTNCGFWQRYFDVPPDCPVCTDYRHPLPADGWSFWTADEVDRRVEVTWCEVLPDLWMFTATPGIGIGSCGFLVVREEGNIVFEGCGWYSDAALDQVESLGGVRWLAYSHAHVQGALWRLAERFRPEVVCHTEQLPTAQALPVAWPFDDRADLGDGAALLHTGGHTPGHSVLYLADRRMLFCGDALKYKLDAAPVGRPLAVSTHKAYDAHIPLTHDDMRRYRDLFAGLDVEMVVTPWEVVPEGGLPLALAMLDAQAARRPSADWFAADTHTFVPDDHFDPAHV
ncbi:MAG: MBL fold metallo-hydrolase [Bacteroidota bacterium]